MVMQGQMRIDHVDFPDGEAAPAAPARPEWKAERDAVSGLTLAHNPGEPLNKTWVCRQFTENQMVGQTVGADRIAALIQLINLAYLHNGYINSGVLRGPGDGSDGTLHLRLIWGRLVAPPGGEAIKVSWANDHADDHAKEPNKHKGLSKNYVRKRLRAAFDEPLNIEQVERDFRLLADDPAIATVNANLEPGRNPGEASFTLTVDPATQFDPYVSVANSRSPSVGGERVAVGGTLRNPLFAGGVVSVEYGTTSGLSDFAGGYTTPLFGPGLTFQVRGGFNNAAVVDRPLVPLDIKSREYNVEGGVTKRIFATPLLPTDRSGYWRAAQEAWGGIQVMHRRVFSTLLGEPFSFSPGAIDGRTEYTALQFTGDYTYRQTKRWVATVFKLSATATVGLSGTHPSDPSIASPSQHFSAFLLQANFARRLTPHQLELRLRLSGQLSDGELYSPERFSIGGVNSVRGYREGLLLADEGLAGSVEVAQPFSLSTPRHKGNALDWGSLVASVFADAGYVRNHLGPQPQPTAIFGAGASLAWTPASWLISRVTFAHPFKNVIVAGDRNLQDRGFEFSTVIHPIALAQTLFCCVRKEFPGQSPRAAEGRRDCDSRHR